MTSDTILKLARWRVRDLAACFFACEIPRIDHEEQNCSTSTGHPEVPRKNMVFDPIGERRRKQKDEQKQRTKKSNQKKVSVENSQKITRKSEEGLSRLSSGSHFKEEEYIVFCFKDDGSIHLGKEKRTSEVSNATTVEEEGSDDVELVWPPDEIKEIDHAGNHGDQAKTLSSILSVTESSDSNRSDASSGSFAFPVIDEQFEVGMDGKSCSYAAARRQRTEGTES
ncbi:OLC1v1013957C1 [Oldenlandia corymbosa var. corymbosa]|uniref:OLC1v1013957C1 n=1 Tax=Oldenlandia corymbosa var. corymbosa TaxID=529605 RepID=A0AAV1E1N5_OLDCO|nr:OLC1v1013957C1 [Oldenlandia corymbosa var. corymbosa]